MQNHIPHPMLGLIALQSQEIGALMLYHKQFPPEDTNFDIVKYMSEIVDPSHHFLEVIKHVHSILRPDFIADKKYNLFSLCIIIGDIPSIKFLAEQNYKIFWEKEITAAKMLILLFQFNSPKINSVLKKLETAMFLLDKFNPDLRATNALGDTVLSSLLNMLIHQPLLSFAEMQAGKQLIALIVDNLEREYIQVEVIKFVEILQASQGRHEILDYTFATIKELYISLPLPTSGVGKQTDNLNYQSFGSQGHFKPLGAANTPKYPEVEATVNSNFTDTNSAGRR